MAAERSYHYTLQDIERYLDGRMSAQEMHEMERAALTDPMLTDAIDGYSNADRAVTTKHLNEIAALLHKTEKDAMVIPMPERKPNRLRWVAAAAALGVLGFSAWLMMRDPEVSPDAQLARAEKVVAADSVGTAVPDNTKVLSADTTADMLSVSSLPDADSIRAAKPNIPAMGSTIPEKAAAAEVAVNSTPFENEDTIRTTNEAASAFNQRSLAQNPAAASNARINANAPVATSHSRGFGGVTHFTGQITDEKGNPIPGASVVSGDFSAVTNMKGGFNFSVPNPYDSLKIDISAIGFKKETAMVFSGRNTGIVLQPEKSNMEEIVIVGNATAKKRAVTGSIRDLKIDTLQATEYPYPDGGWDNFYDELITELGVNRTKATKLLHLRFTVENGMPSNFTIIKTPDMNVANKAITAIKKGPRWKNFRKRRNAEVKMKVE